MSTPEVIAGLNADYGRRRDGDGVRWDETYELWVVTRHGGLAANQSETREQFGRPIARPRT